MSTQSLPIRDMEALANIKRISFANKPGKPEVWEKDDAKAVITPPNITALFPRLRTHVKIFVVSTGDDPGDECELQGFIKFTSPLPTISREIDVEMPVKKSWASENGGLGRFLVEFSRESMGCPANFHAFLFEDDVVGDDIILNWGVDWIPANLHMADGRAWTLRSWNTGDTRFRVTLWFQVTQLS